MRRPLDLSQDALVQIVDAVQQSLYLDVRQGVLAWNPAKSWEAADVLMELAGRWPDHDLAPDYVTLIHSVGGTEEVENNDDC